MSLFLLSGPSYAAVFDIPSGDVTALISAINTANSNGEENTIKLEAGTYSLIAVDNGSGPDANGLPVITGVISIVGSGAQTTIVERSLSLIAAPRFRIFDIAAGARLTINQLIISGGVINGDGGGIRNAGNLVVKDSIIENNLAVRSGGGGGAGNGGGILSFGTVAIINSTIADNLSDGETGEGGGLANLGGMAIVQKSAITGNASRSGGGLFNAAMMEVLNSTITNNRAGPGAGIANVQCVSCPTAAAVRIVNSTIFDNNSGPTLGPPTVIGGGIFSSVLATTEIQNSIVAGNTLTSPPFPFTPGRGPDCFGPMATAGNNIIGDITDCGISLLATDFVGDPGLDAFTDNGTPGNGHFPLLETSPAIDAGNNDVCLSEPVLATDQIGNPRIGTCDIGAIEFSSVLTIALDIRPGSAENPINPKSNGVIPVAILGTNGFDASTIDQASLRFGPGQALAEGNGHLVDLNGDGQLDLVLHFRTQDSGIQCGDTSVSITGQTLNGTLIQGSDSITTVGCKSMPGNQKKK